MRDGAQSSSSPLVVLVCRSVYVCLSFSSLLLVSSYVLLMHCSETNSLTHSLFRLFRYWSVIFSHTINAVMAQNGPLSADMPLRNYYYYHHHYYYYYYCYYYYCYNHSYLISTLLWSEMPSRCVRACAVVKKLLTHSLT